MADTDTSFYKENEWEGGQVITALRLNKMVQGIENAIQEPFVGLDDKNNPPKEGLVPVPTRDDEGAFLSAKGTWEKVETPNDKVKVDAAGTNIIYKILLQSNSTDTAPTYTAVSSDEVSVTNNIITAKGFWGSGERLANLNGDNITDGTIGANYLPKLNQIDNQNTQTSTITQGIIEDIETNHLSAIGNKLKIKFLKDDFKVSSTDVGKVLMVDNEGYVALSSVKFASAEAGF